ncbi:MAG TPA: ATP synthase F1 subunit delta [Solirubrobacteraceae bacterium]|jgi:ATP synthase F1 delta subunit|nr:ATP synthase F1 subunit delta [Solirubrobacteraceae bacterium]
MEEIAQVYARSLFEVASERDQLDVVKQQLDQFAGALHENRELAVFFFSPYFSADEKKNGLHSAVEGADPAFMNFLEALIERHRMPAIFRIRADFEALYDKSNKLLPVTVTSAVELDAETIESLGKRIGEQTGNEIELTSSVDPEILGGIVLRVGNFIMDASIRTRLEKLRREVAQA